MKRCIQNEKIVTLLGDAVNLYNQALQKLPGDKKDTHILMFHDVTEYETEAQRNKAEEDDYSVNMETFRNVISWHQKQGYSFIGIEQVFQKKLGKLKCIVTFDDAFAGVYYNAYPYLKKLNIPFTIYVITDLIGAPDYMTEEQLIELSMDPLCTIGSHTCSHPMTRYLSDDELRRELTESKKVLEKILKRPVCHFAYPYGSYYTRSVFDTALVKEAGYKTAVTTFQYHMNRVKSLYHIPRYDASRTDLIKVF